MADNPTLASVATLGKGLEYRGEDLPQKSTTWSTERFEGAEAGFVLFDSGLELHELPSRYWMNLDTGVIRRPLSGTTVGTPQVLLNYAPASRGPWRLKALIDRQGHAVTSNFIAVRPTTSFCSLETLWALLNSPIANAYAFSHLGRRHNISGDIRNIPIPKVISFRGVEGAASAYLRAASSATDSGILRKLLLRVDDEVLKLYSLPSELEKSLLELFTDCQRVGVSFKQVAYLPRDLAGRVRFSDFLQFEEDWSATNRERGALIDRDIAGNLRTEQRARLDSLQAYADYHIDKVSPRPEDMLDELEAKLFPDVPMKGGDVDR